MPHRLVAQDSVLSLSPKSRLEWTLLLTLAALSLVVLALLYIGTGGQIFDWNDPMFP